MGKIIYLMGKSSSGKDTIFRELIERHPKQFQKIVSYTTRPIRIGEVDGNEYHFVDERKFLELQKRKLVIEQREYHTYCGVWRYFTVDDGKVDLEYHNYIVIGTLESYLSMSDYYGTSNMIPIFIDLDDGVRLQRALQREIQQDVPKYEELCRRYLADNVDFSNENLKKAKINKRFINDNLENVLEQLEQYIAHEL